jgi:hypothetical protein
MKLGRIFIVGWGCLKRLMGSSRAANHAGRIPRSIRGRRPFSGSEASLEVPCRLVNTRVQIQFLNCSYMFLWPPTFIAVFTVEPRFTNLIRSWRPFVTRNVRKPKLFLIYKKPQNRMKFKRRHGEFEQGCVLSESCTATDALPRILPACRQPLLPACVFVTRDTVVTLDVFCSENLFVMRGVREPRFHCTRRCI